MTTVSVDSKIACPICNEEVHVMKNHLQKAHPEMTFEQFRAEYPEAPLLSPYARSLVERKKRATQAAEAAETKQTDEPTQSTETKQPTQDTEPTETKQPTQTTEPTETKQPTQTTEPTETKQSTQTTEPTEATQPTQDNTISTVVENEAPHVLDLERKAKVEVIEEKVALHELIELPLEKCCNARGEAIMVTRLKQHGFMDLVPEKKHYVWDDVERAKDAFMALEIPGLNGYFWGHYGTGKSSLITQACALTNRPMIRVQHTANVEEAHIVGQMLVSAGSTYFNPGFLTLSMRYGFVYLADEYDFAFPQIVSVYQPVLEGERLVNKEATANWSQIKPHEHFRFIATGNTNGSGDDSGLYQGTNIQNAANYSRFGITSQVNYMAKETEAKILTTVCRCLEEDAMKLVEFAHKIREGFEKGDISHPTGPRELINAAKIGTLRGNYRMGLDKAFINRLPAASAHAASEIAQRIFG